MTRLLLSDTCAVIVGASQGIGADIARTFAEHGAEVILLARNETNLASVAREIHESGGKAHIFPMDVSNEGSWLALTDWIRNNGLTCQVLVNNAYWRSLVPFGQVSNEEWQRTVDVTLKSCFLGSRSLIPFMLACRRGSIINISSLQSHIPEPSFGVYAVAKAGVDSLSRVIARDYGPVIRANTIVVGAVDTPGFAEGEEAKRELGKRLPLGRIGTGKEIADIALFFASSLSSFVTGAELVADGGRSLT